MQLKVGQTLTSSVDTTSVVVVRCSDDEVTLTCGGAEMGPQGSAPGAPAAAGAPGEGLAMGKRYAAEDVGLELLCVRGGGHPVAVNGATLGQKTAQPLPASD